MGQRGGGGSRKKVTTMMNRGVGGRGREHL